MISQNDVTFAALALLGGARVDGRGAHEARAPAFAFERSEGRASAEVALAGGTRVHASVSAEVCPPFEDRPLDGFLVFSVELLGSAGSEEVAGLRGGGRRVGMRKTRRLSHSAIPYSLHPSEHGPMTAAGLPSVSPAALARVKGRSRASAPKIAVALRRGKWIPEEEDFTNGIVEHFRSGLLPLEEETTLRTFLSCQLHCAWK